jgi:hypothetical protein
MKTTAIVALVAIMAGSVVFAEEEKRCFELRTYYAAPGKLEALNARFREHTLKLFEKHGMENIGYWTPVENPDNQLIYLLAFPNREAATQSWKNFRADPAWLEVVKQTEAGGRLVTKVDSIYLAATDFSPPAKPLQADPARVFELRTYTAAPGKLGGLQARFRDHTVALFTRHGMVNFGYWTPLDSKRGAESTLIYLLAHKDREAAAASFEAFRKDPEWLKAKAESEKNGPLATKVESVFLRPTDYSPSR